MTAAIIGLYNSGSSILARITSLLGCELGPPYWWNTFESRILRAQLIDWWNEPELVECVEQTHRVAFLKWWRNYYSTPDKIVCAKHPLLCLSAKDLPLAWGDDVKYIRAYRDLNESIEKLDARGWFGTEDEPEAADRIQKQLWDASEAFFTQHEHLCFDYNKLLEHPEKQIAMLVDYLDLSPTGQKIQQAIAAVKRPD